MKIRNGFVSNSSTSSFLIYGVSFEPDEVFEKLSIDREADDLEEYEVYEKLSEELDMDYEAPYDWGSVYFGTSWSGIGDDETGAEFKAKIEKKLKEKFGADIECSTHEGAWRDG